GPSVQQPTVTGLRAGSLDDHAPLSLRSLSRARAEAQAEHLDRRHRIARSRRRSLPRTLLTRGWTRMIGVGLGELDDDALRLARMQEGLLPLRIGVVVTDDRVAVSAGAIARRHEARHRERDVVNPRPALREEAVQEAVGAGGLEDLQIATALVAPVAKAE